MPLQTKTSAPGELTIVMPVYNEEANIGAVVAEWCDQLRSQTINFRILAFNDGSTDSTSRFLHDLSASMEERLQTVDKPNSGHGLSCRMGYDMALETGAPWVLQIDSDGQCDPRFFPEFWNRREQYDCIFGVRTTRDDGLGRKCISLLCRFAIWMLSGVDPKDANVPYRLMRRKALERALKKVPSDFELQNIALTLALKKDRAIRWLHPQIHFRARQGGEHNLNFRKIVKLGWQMLRELRRVKA